MATTHEELVKQIRESAPLIERLDKCHEMIGKMCAESRPPKMTIPVQWHDEDLFIATTLQDAQEFIKTSLAFNSVLLREE